MAQVDYNELNLAELAQRLIDTISALVEKQVELAKQEAREDLRSTVRGAIILIAGAGLLLFATICLLTALMSGTAALFSWPLWLAALLWLVIFAIAGAVCLWLGRQRIRTHPLERTRTIVKEELAWAKQRLKPPAR